jgi:hypothetical protein
MWLAVSMLNNDEAQGATTLLEAAIASAGSPPSSITMLIFEVVRAQLQLYRGSADGCRASFYLLEDFFSSPLAAIPLPRAHRLLVRAKLALIARASAGRASGMLRHAAAATEEAARLGVPCFEHDVWLLRASVAVGLGREPEALAALDHVALNSGAPALHRLFAQRAKGQLVKGAEGQRLVAQAEADLTQRGIANPRRMARLFVPSLEELAAALPQAPT